MAKRGDVWLTSFSPTVGTEIRKTRPAVVVSSDSVGRLPIKLVAPFTDWKTHVAPNMWHIHIDPDSTNGLSKPSAVDVMQLRGVDAVRLVKRLGELTSQQMEEIVLAIGAVIEYP